MRRNAQRLPDLGLTCLLFAAGHAVAQGADFADSEWALCGDPDHLPRVVPRPSEQELEQAETRLSADQSEVLGEEIFNFSGDVEVRRADQELYSDRARYHRSDATVEAEGNVRYLQSGLGVEADSAFFNLDTREGKADNARYLIAEKHAHGKADTVLLEGRDHTRLKGATYTTCNPDKVDWLLHSSAVKLDHKEGVGVARNVWVGFKGVPIFYSPYMSFPLDDRRKSGFLTPSIGTSDEVGTDIRIPYYFNLAPNRDATLTLRNTTRRGQQVLGELRYLYPTHQGEMHLGYLPDDDISGRDRKLFTFRDQGQYRGRWSSRINFNYVSDPHYFEQLGDDLKTASITHLERLGEITYRGDLWTATGRLQAYQTVDRTIPAGSRPYQRLPQLLFSGNLPSRTYGLHYSLSGEYVRFNQAGSVTADRIDLQPGVQLPLSTPAAYLTPALSLRHTHYAFDNRGGGLGNHASRTVPVASLDSGAFFERDTNWGDTPLTHTLEPRLYYLYVPFRSQAELPNFDSGTLDLGVLSNLFQTNRFSGVDRVGDANQVTYALTTRLLQRESGAELLRAAVGQIYYFRDRKVTLPGGDVERSVTSNIVGELSSTDLVQHWRATAGVVLNSQTDDIDKTTLGLRYSPDKYRMLDLSYRFQRDSLEQTDVSALWPLARNQERQWNAVARWNYSIKDNLTLEALGGVEYDTCCWTVRLAARRFLNSTAGDTNDAILLQLELKGLSRVGHKEYRKGLPGLLDPVAYQR
jgi:LPS-assembly protein